MSDFSEHEKISVYFGLEFYAFFFDFFVQIFLLNSDLIERKNFSYMYLLFSFDSFFGIGNHYSGNQLVLDLSLAFFSFNSVPVIERIWYFLRQSYLKRNAVIARHKWTWLVVLKLNLILTNFL